MARLSRLLALLLVAAAARADTTDTTTTSSESDGVVILSGTKSVTLTEQTPTGSYQSYSTQVTLASTTSSTDSLDSITSNATTSESSSTTSSVTYLTGSVTTTSSSSLTGNFSITSSSTSTSAAPTNTQPCNNWAEFCSRKYSNITMVAAHNSPFVKPGNSAANQQLDVTTQLNDGIRFLQAQIQWPTNGTVPHFCHTSCDVLDAGPITDWLGKVNTWVASHPYDVVTILLGNGNYSSPDLYAPFIESTGITQYAYTPNVIPMALDNWPTLSELILTGKRVIMFMDYQANQTAYPWLLDEFSQMWETPFDPTDNSFPCTVARPPDLSTADASNRLSLINHNLNVEVSILGTSLLIPAITQLNVTNNVSGTGSLGLSANNCRSTYDRAPNFLNVDYYNYGGFPGSVFEVAALMNNVTYDRTCCGKVASGSHRTVDGVSSWAAAVVGVASFLVLL
ncbi:PLC-like phosphodiesterase [Pleurostoma richardsiae]|uniref:PLC-like phosphodiesterase n=1 Tax=Pleurostoma richardsiae TaxID=41990 RepID=A0AA38S5P6_9PEZI|nr:PLC-like phosphodiesterase [Pleurostoma richardsiae]